MRLVSDENPAGEQWWLTTYNGDEDREILNFGPTAKVTADWTYDGRVAFCTDTLDGKRHDSVAIGLCTPSTGEIDWLVKPGEEEPYDNLIVPKYSQHLIMIKEREGRSKSFLYHLELETTINTTPLR